MVDNYANLPVDYKIDLDNAINHMGQGYWPGDLLTFNEFSLYRINYNLLQRVIIADITGYPLNECDRVTFKLRELAYKLLLAYLNED